MGILFDLAGAVLQMLSPNSIRELMNYLQFCTEPEYDFGIIKGYAITAGVLIFSSFVFSCLQSVILSSTARKVSCSLKAAINDKLDRLPVKLFYEHRTGDIQSRVTNDVDQIATALSNNIASIVCAVATLIVCIVIMVETNGTLTLVAIGNAVVGLIITEVIVVVSTPFVTKRQELLGVVNAEVYEAFGGHLVIKPFNCEKDVIEAGKMLKEAITGQCSRYCLCTCGPMRRGRTSFFHLQAAPGALHCTMSGTSSKR